MPPVPRVPQDPSGEDQGDYGDDSYEGDSYEGDSYDGDSYDGDGYEDGDGMEMDRKCLPCVILMRCGWLVRYWKLLEG